MGVQINGSEGNVIATKGTYSGNVTIGGTLTYEDVTNIDSVGLVTARTGIEIGARPGVAASISVDGNAIFSGIITARSNILVGSGITLSPDGDVFTTGVSTFIGNIHLDTDVGGENNRLLVGSNSTRNIGGSAAVGYFQIEGTSGNSSSVSLVNNQNATNSPVIRFGKTRGTSTGAVTTVADGDLLGSIAFAGADGTDLENSTARIKAIVNGTVAGNQIPTDIVFETSATDGNSKTERVRIQSDGNLSIPGNSSVKDITYGDGSTTGYFRSTTNVNRSNAEASIHMQQFKWNNTKVAEINVITGDDTTNKDNAHIIFETADSGTTAERLRIASSGQLLVNHTTGRGVGNANVRLLQVEGTDGKTAITCVRNSNNGSGAGLLLGKSRTSSVGGNTIVQDDDKLGVISFCGADGVDLLSIGAQITGEVDGTPGENDMPGRIVFKTTSDGSASSSERVRITSNGRLGINVTDPAERLHVAGNGRFNKLLVNTDAFHNSGKFELKGHSTGSHTAMRVQDSSGSQIMILRCDGYFQVSGALSKGSGSFAIDHPLPNLASTKILRHSFIEGPQCDNIYRGKVTLSSGTTTINLDTKSRMTEGTFVALNRDVQCFTTNETGWTNVKGSVTGNQLTIIAQDNTCTDTISWMVIGERQDPNIKTSVITDDDGYLIVEQDKVDSLE
jgi:hypothetical protein